MPTKLKWRKSIVFLAALPERGSRSREGAVREDGLVAVPPLRADKRKAWAQRLGLTE